MSRVCVNAREVRGEVSVSGDFMEEPGTALYPGDQEAECPVPMIIYEAHEKL